MHRLYIFSFIFSLLSVGSLPAQELSEKKFTGYTTANGLSDNTISGMAQDAAGYIWLCTYSGLNRYDGSRFKQFHSTNDSLSPAAEEFLGLSWLNKEEIAFFTTGLHVVNTRTGKTGNVFVPFADKQYAYKFNMTVAALSDTSGGIFLLTRSGFYHFDKTHKLLFRYDYYQGNKVTTEHFVFGRELMQLDSRRLLVVALDGLYLYDKEKRQFKKMEAKDDPLFAEFVNYPGTEFKFFQPGPGQFFILRSDGDTLVYVNTARNKKVISILPFQKSITEFGWRSKLVAYSDTVFYITAQLSGFYKATLNPATGVVQLDPEKYFPTYLCHTLLVDKDKNLWVGTNRGLFRQDNVRSHVELANIPPSLEDSFPGIRIHSIFATDNKIYAGTRSGGGLLVFDKQTMKFEKQTTLINEAAGLPVYKISCLAPHTLLLGTGGPLLIYDEPTGRQTKLIPPGWDKGFWTNELYKDRPGNMWVASATTYKYHIASKQFSVIPGSQSMPSIPVGFAEDTSGNIWIAGHGIVRYNAKLNSFDRQLDSFPYIKMPDKQVTAMLIDQQNTIWFSCANNGLISYNISSRSYRHYTRHNGLPDDNIASLIIVGEKLWIASYSGIACMDLHSMQIKKFGKDEGIPEMPILRGSKFFYDAPAQQLYLGFYNVILRFNPNAIISLSAKPAVFVEDITLNGQRHTYLPGNRFSTSWTYNDLVLNIGSINFSDGHSQGYAYRIYRNEQSPWQQLGSQSSFSISNLAPGTHRIQYKVFSLNNRWPEQVKEIVIEVLPPFWQKAWFRLAVLAVLLLLLYLFISWRTHIARKKEMEKTRIQQLVADDYKNRYELEQISNYFSSSLTGKKNADDVLWDVAGHLIGRMKYVDCMIYLWNDTKTKMIQKAAYGPKGKPEYISSQVFDVLPGQGVVGHVMETRQPVLIKDTRKDSRYRVDEAFRLSEVCVPIIHNNELLGIIDSEHHEADYFTERDIKILTTIATLIANKLKQLESEKTLEVKQRELASINEQLAEAKLSALQAQMNPHFVFNALNSIKRMILDGDNDTASRYLSKFALMIRMTLTHSGEAFVTLTENIEYLKTYLEMEQLRFDGSFAWHISVGNNIETEDTLIPSLMMQPLVENAIWHGLLPSASEKKLRIDFRQHEHTMTCIIEDNGIGISQSMKEKELHKKKHHSVGLDNLRKRIKILNEKFGTACTLVITDLADEQENKSGTRVTLTFMISNT